MGLDRDLGLGVNNCDRFPFPVSVSMASTAQKRSEAESAEDTERKE